MAASGMEKNVINFGVHQLGSKSSVHFFMAAFGAVIRGDVKEQATIFMNMKKSKRLVKGPMH